MMTAPAPPNPTAEASLTADVGGTWMRLRTGGANATVERFPSPSLINYPDRTVSELREELTGLLCDAAPYGAYASISLGAAIDHHTGTIYGSAPMWGPESGSFDMQAELQLRRPDVTWRLVNDVTAALVDFAATHAHRDTRRIGYLTVSSGIAIRIADTQTNQIPVDTWGLQGEIGHLPAMITNSATHLAGLMCECGQPGHVASFASGPGIRRVAEKLGIYRGAAFSTWFPKALAAQNQSARQLLKLSVEPIANMLRTMWCLDPHLDIVGLGGGVVEGLGAPYADELRFQLGRSSTYADRGRSETWLTDHLLFCEVGTVDALRGAETTGHWLPGVVE